MNDELKERVHALLHAHHVDIAFNERGYGAIAGAITALLAEVRAETEARVVEAAANECSDRSKRYTCTAIELEKLGHLSTGEEVRLEARMARECEQAIRALAPGDYVAVRREDFGVLAEAAEELEARIRMERAGYESSRADEIRAALSRAAIS